MKSWINISSLRIHLYKVLFIIVNHKILSFTSQINQTLFVLAILDYLEHKCHFKQKASEGKERENYVMDFIGFTDVGLFCSV